MTEILHVRGPDGRGDFVSPGIMLGHTRLAIIDLSDAGSQPMTDNSGRYTIVYNGEVYNFKELKGGLAGNYRFKSNTDTEVVLASYIRWGKDCLKRFNGMFAFAIWDSVKRELFLARDRLGVKPLFYAPVNGSLLFASEQKSIIASGMVERKINAESIYHFLSFYHIPEPQTAYEGIYSLPAGHFAVYSENNLRTERWWQPDFQKSGIASDRKAADQLRMYLDDSTQLRQVSDVPVGCFLSGGVDSTAVSALMQRAVGSGFRTYTVSFNKDPLNAPDVHYAELASKYIGSIHEYRNYTLKEIDSYLPSILWRLEEPAWSSLESWFASKLAKEGITVSLAGVGGDELFAGYFPYSHVYRAQGLKKFLGPFASPAGALIKGLDSILPESVRRFPPFPTMHRYASIDNLDYASAYFNLRSTFTDDEKHQLLDKGFLNRVSGLSSRGYVVDLMKKVKTEGFIDKFTLFDIQNYLSADLLRHMDSMSMSHSLEVRVPLLDYRFVEAALSLPDDMKIKDGRSKYVFQMAVDELLPMEIKNRSKVGFIFPMSRWLREDFAPQLRAVLESNSLANRKIFDPTYVKNLMEKYFAGDESQWLRLWSVMSVELWARMYIDSDGSEPKGVSFTEMVS